jgi:integrase
MARRKAGEGSVYQRKDGSWVAQHEGVYRYAKDEATARQKLYKLLAGAEESRPENITVSRHLDDYFKYAQANLKPRTVKRYREAIEVHLKPALGKHKLHALDAQTIEDVYASKLQEGQSPASISVMHAVLSASLKRAVRSKLIQHNPCRDVVKPKKQHIEEDDGVKVFKPQEVQDMLRIAAENPETEAMYALVLSTGLRVGELLGLKRADVNLDERTLRISRTVYNGAVGSPKSKRSRRTISLPKMAHEALERHIDRFHCEDWLFPSKAGTPHWYCTFIDRKWRPLLKRAGVPYKGIHTARHTVASQLLAKGMPIPAVARFMGHDEQTLLSTYSHLLPDQMQAIAATMDSLLQDDQQKPHLRAL